MAELADTITKASSLEHSKASSQWQSIMSSSFPISLKFMDVCYKVKLDTNRSRNYNIMGKLLNNKTKGPTTADVETSMATNQERTILNGVTGMAKPGEILAVLGPSGSGKSTLLNTLAGRIHHNEPGGQGKHHHHHHHLTGTILANNRKLTKSILRRTGFVSQEDVLYANLTVRETLIFCSLLRLPTSLTKKEKISAAEWVIAELGLSKCENTIIGNNNSAFKRGGISGGERKRVSIGHEMLINPSLLILDEPTSGLDSTAAFRLVTVIESLARKGKTIVMSVHQPSSMVYQMFSSVLVLSTEGRCLYFGKGNEAMNYFECIGFSPSFHMINPADFLLDLANGVYQLRNNDKDKTNVKQTLLTSYSRLLAPQVKATCIENDACINPQEGIITSVVMPSTIKGYASSWLNQFSILLERSLKERRHDSFNSLRVFQVVAAALLAGSIWWHSDFRDIQDRLGLLFFIAIFWGVLPSFNASYVFPQERAIVMKERASGMYTLSSYFVARVIGDIPMELILPIIFISISYWMAWLKPELYAFVVTLVVLLGYVLVSQGLGLALGAIIMDAKLASTVVTVTMLAFVLTGGFYVHKISSYLEWTKYISMTFYAYRLLVNVQYGDGVEISSLIGCNRLGHVNDRCKSIGQDIEGQIHPFMSAGILLLMFLGYRMIAYLALRCI